MLTRVLSSELHGVSPLDPVTYGSVAIVMAIVTLAACSVPTRRALRVDPLIAFETNRATDSTDRLEAREST